MGLDMYFYGKRYFYSFDKESVEIAKKIKDLLPEVCGAEIKEVKVELHYWRKFNALHKWFTDNIQDGVDNCEEYYVESEKLYNLRDVCEKIIADKSLAPELLPTSSGFFFGATEYDEYYFSRVTDLKNWLDDFLIKDSLGVLEGWEYYYRASW